MQGPGAPQTCQSGVPLTYQNISIYRITATGTFNLTRWTGTGGISYNISANAGVLNTGSGTGSAGSAPASANAAPIGVAVFSFHNAGITVSEAGTPSISLGKAFRMYAEADNSSTIQTGVAVQNAGAGDASVNFVI